MKKVTLAIVFVFGLMPTLFAQGKGKVEFGLNVGFNGATVYDEDYTSDSGAGFNVGASADYYITDRWSVKAKLIYDQKGWNNGIITVYDSFDPNDPGFDYETNYNLNYLTVPVMAGFHFGFGGNQRNFYVNAGPYVGFLVSAKDTRFDEDVKDAFNTTDFGLAFAVGVKVPVNNRLKVYFEFDGQSGMTDIFKYNDDPAVYNSRGSLNVGLNFLMN